MSSKATKEELVSVKTVLKVFFSEFQMRRETKFLCAEKLSIRWDFNKKEERELAGIF